MRDDSAASLGQATEPYARQGLTGGSGMANDILNALAHPVLLIDPDDRIIGSNLAAEQFFQTSTIMLARHTLAEMVPFGSPVLPLIDQVRQRDATVSEYRIDIGSPKLGLERTVDVYASPVAERPGHVSLMLLPRSVTEKIDRQLSHRGAARTVSGLAAMLAHEIKNPLSGIRGASQLLEANLDPEDRTLTQLIRDEADRIVGLVDRMNEFGDERPVDRGPVNIHIVLERVRILASTGFAKGVRFIEDYDPSLPPVYADHDQLVQVVLNLVKNAAEALKNQPDPEIRLRTAFRPGIKLALQGSKDRISLPLEIAVIDNGSGIADDMLPHIFDPFVTSKINGTGLGLALVAKIIDDHGGVIECDAKHAQTVFRILMPTHAPEERWNSGANLGGDA